MSSARDQMAARQAADEPSPATGTPDGGSGVPAGAGPPPEFFGPPPAGTGAPAASVGPPPEFFGVQPAGAGAQPAGAGTGAPASGFGPPSGGPPAQAGGFGPPAGGFAAQPGGAGALPGGASTPAGGPGLKPGQGGHGGERRAGPFRAGSDLSSRLGALARLVQIGAARGGADGISPDLLDDASALLARAGQRLRLSSSHTVVALAGGTGSGKSSLFNRLAGADFSTVGVTRPVTRDVHACVWGVSGSGALLEWLGVPRRYRYARASALDSGERDMTGLVLLDMPDHDSVMAHASQQVDHLVELADLMVWVLDPQKYADAAVHRRFLVPLAGHSEVIAVVLNQSDVLAPAQLEDCVNDLRRLLDAEELHDVQIIVTSAVTGDGVDGLRGQLADAVSARRAAAARITADVDGVAVRFAPYAGEDPAALTQASELLSPAADGPAAAQVADIASAISVLVGSPRKLAAAFARAAGVGAIGDALQSARELRAVDYVGWPVSWLVERVVRRDPVRKIRLGKLWAELRGVTAGPSGAQQAEIDNALTELADEVSPGLPKPWSQTIRTAIRSRADDIPGALGERIGESLPAENKIAPWWRAVGVWQGLLLGLVIVGLLWLVAVLIFGVFGAGGHVPGLFSDVSLLPLIVILIAAMLVLGWLTASACINAVRTAAVRENEQVAEDMQNRMASVAQELVVAPAQQELSELDRFRAELRVALGQSR
jgi:GTP-binding protein EngB required for normal cell division